MATALETNPQEESREYVTHNHESKTTQTGPSSRRSQKAPGLIASAPAPRWVICGCVPGPFPARSGGTFISSEIPVSRPIAGRGPWADGAVRTNNQGLSVGVTEGTDPTTLGFGGGVGV
ncbi:unnamed protein product [Gadus morhua 'NCC']